MPAAITTYVKLAESYPNTDSAEAALWRLSELYDDLRRYDLAAQALETLGGRFPNTRHDVWWRAGELYRAAPSRQRQGHDRLRENPAELTKVQGRAKEA